MEDNLAGHFSFLPGVTEGMLVEEAPDLVLVDSGLPTDTFNAICRARLGRDGAARERIQESILHFRRRNLPFSWWLGPRSMPATLDEELEKCGLSLAEQELGMAADISRVSGPAITADGLEIRRISDEHALSDYARVLAANCDPPDEAVCAFYARVLTAVLQPDCPARLFLGYAEGKPVAASECFLWGGVAGIYNVVTLTTARRRGFGSALTIAAILEASKTGYRTAVLQASAQGQAIYARLGFVQCGAFREYKPDH
jgi:ribosomal protein S18 acetylase RimI-like enzyme